MSKIIISDVPSALYRKQIANISAHMRELTVRAILHPLPLRSMTGFHKAEKDFVRAKDVAYSCCSVMDTASVENEDRATNATAAVMTEMIRLKNEASNMIKNEPQKRRKDSRP